MTYDLGAMLVRRKKHGYRCGDLFIIVGHGLGSNYRVLSIHKDGKINVSLIRESTLDEMYVVMGFTHSINDLIDIVKDMGE